jgi:hypothetical protein
MQQQDKDQKPAPPVQDQTTPRTEKDPDELVHEQGTEVPEINSATDLDELVHQVPPKEEPDPLQEIDPDDIIHHSSEPDEDLEVGGEG